MIRQRYRYTQSSRMTTPMKKALEGTKIEVEGPNERLIRALECIEALDPGYHCKQMPVILDWADHRMFKILKQGADQVTRRANQFELVLAFSLLDEILALEFDFLQSLASRSSGISDALIRSTEPNTKQDFRYQHQHSDMLHSSGVPFKIIRTNLATIIEVW